MATNGLPRESVNFWRTGILLLNVGTPVLRRLLETKARTDNITDIDRFLQTESRKQILQRLDSRVLPRDSKDKLYPPNNERTNVETWDVTLLCVVLKEACTLSPIERGHIDEIRTIRNTQFAHNAAASLDDNEFVRVWGRTEAAINGILETINDATFTESIKVKVKQYQDGDLLQSDVERARNDLDKWKENIQMHLISQYTNYRAILPVAPLYDDEGLRISELYTHVTLYDDTRFGRDRDFTREDNQVTSYRDMFYWRNTGEPAKLILLKGPAGRGKSSFCLRMANVWVSAMTKKRVGGDALFTDDEKEMLNYDFVFFLALRFASMDSAFDMVKDQLFKESPMYVQNLERCFHSCNCLLILDGLDEWTSVTQSPLPNMDNLYNCTRIISTRPWKLQAIPSNMNIRVLEIGIMDENAIRTLVTKIFANYYQISVSHQERMVNQFMHALKKHSLDSMAEIPLILTYLVCLWRDENGLEESKTVNYGGLLESLMRYGKAELAARRTRKLPGSLSFRQKSCMYSVVLYKLAEFAFKSIVDQEQPTLVFKKAQVDQYFDDADELQFCLKNGLLSQSKAPGARANDNVIIQFFHKSVQEFLAALYVAMSKSDSVSMQLQHQLRSINKILALSNVLIFICGLRPQLCNTLTKTIADVAEKSPEIQRYRRSLEGRFAFRKSRSLTSYRTIKDIQELVHECVKECRYNKRFAGAVRTPVQVAYGTIFTGGSWRVKPTLRDFVIKETSGEDAITLIQENSKDAKSIYIDSPPRKIVPQITHQIQNARHLLRLHLDQVSSGLIYDLDVSRLRHLQSLSLVLDNISQFPSNISSLVHLKALSLSISGTHQVIVHIIEYLKSANQLEEVDLEKIRCVTHRGQSRCDLSLDVSNNNTLTRLSVQELSVLDVMLSPVVDLGEVWLSGWMYNPSSVVSRLPACRSLTTLILGDLFAFNCFHWMSDDIKMIADVLPRLESLKHLHLLGITFGEHVPVLSPNVHLETLSVEDVTLRDHGWMVFLRSLIDIPNKQTSGLISTREDAYPIQLFGLVSREHFSNVTISRSRNRAVIKFDTKPAASTDGDEEEIVACTCAIHQVALEIYN